VELDQLRLVVDVAREGSFTRAAARNQVTQPAVTLRIQRLEDELGTRLFERTTRRVVLTEDGRLLYDYARDILARVEDAVTALAERQGKMVGTIRIATIHSIGLHELPQYLKLFIQSYPLVRIHVEYHTAETVYRMVRQGEADLGVVAYPEARTSLNVVSIQEDEMVVITSRDHTLAGRTELTLDDLCGQDFVAFESAIPTRRAMDEALARAGCHVNVRMECDNVEILKRMVEVGLGMGIVPAFSVREEVREGSLAMMRIAGMSLKRPLGIVYWKAKTLTRPMEALIGLLQQPLPGADPAEPAAARQAA
jgi:LysR family transcriptional regulator, transcriptional activator of the cysJI operon